MYFIRTQINDTARLKLTGRIGRDSQPDLVSFKAPFDSNVWSYLIVVRHRLGLPVDALDSVKDLHQHSQVEHKASRGAGTVEGSPVNLCARSEERDFPLWEQCPLTLILVKVASHRRKLIGRVKRLCGQICEPTEP